MTGRTEYFLGANSPGGFYSLFDSAYNPDDYQDVYLIKGGPGCGKSSFIKKIAERLEQVGVEAEYILCSSDPDSCDGVLFPSIGAAILDATSPHVLEPHCVGAVEKYLDFSQFLITAPLQKRKTELLCLGTRLQDSFDSLFRSLRAIRCLKEESMNLIKSGVSLKKVEERGERLAAREVRGSGLGAKLRRRFLTGVDEGGIHCCYESVLTGYEQVFELRDRYGLGSSFLKPILDRALKKEFEVIACYCPLSPENKLDHLLIPELSLAFVTSNEYHTLPGTPARRINLNRMLDSTVYNQCKVRLKFLKNASTLFLEDAAATMGSIKKAHNTLEKIYIDQMDFQALDLMRVNLCDHLLRLAENR